YRDNPFLNGGDIDSWLEKQRLAYHGNDIGFKIEVLGEEFDFGTSRFIKDFSVCDDALISKVRGSFYTGVHVKGHRVCFIEVLVGKISYLPITIVTNASSKVLLSREDYALECARFRGTFVLPHTREELRFVFSKFGRGTLIARSRNLYVLSDYLIPNNLNVLSREETQDVILELSLIHS
ncbi:terminase large subunit, partial [Pseudomonas aeruginosa]|uniref:terminase large subunit n=1 Tax=Pseudomonas aeruginosa TaxID=287 RepID=UPI001CA52816